MSIRRSSRLLAKATPKAAEATPAVPKPQSPDKVTKTRQRKPASSRKSRASAASLPSTSMAAVTASSPQPSGGPFLSLADPNIMDQAIAHLKQADPKLGEFIDRTKKKCTMALSRGKEDDTSYISLCESIIYQQLAGKAAAAILLKFLKRYGKLKDESKAPLLDQENSGLDSGDFIFPSPELVATLDVAEMKAVGLGQRKAEYLKEVASKFNDGTLSDSMLASLPDEDVSKALVAIRGIGQWTADMFLMFHLKRANVLPTLDLAIRKAMCHHFGAKFGKNTPTHDEMVEMGRIWEPYRSVATWYMWQTMSTVTQEK